MRPILARVLAAANYVLPGTGHSDIGAFVGQVLHGGYQAVPLLRQALSAIWLTGLLGWFAEDSGVTVPAAAFPLVLPLTIAVLSSLPPRPAGSPPAPVNEDDRQPSSASPDPGYL